MNTQFKTFLLFLMLVGSAKATSLRNEWSDLFSSLRDCLKDYSADHGGQLPKSLPSFPAGIEYAKKNSEPIETKVVYFPESPPTIYSPTEVGLIAMTSFLVRTSNSAINPNIGRYILTQDRIGEFGLHWEKEEKIQAALAKANLSFPPSGPIYEEKETPDPLFGIRLLQDALDHGVSQEVAGPIIEAHFQEVQAGRAKKATTWAEIANNPPPRAPAVNGTQPASAPPTPSASPFKWLLLAAATLAGLVLGWRLLRRK
jgi:hypothetical protein